MLRRLWGSGFPRPPFTPLRAALCGEESSPPLPTGGLSSHNLHVLVPTDIRMTLPSAELVPHCPSSDPGTFLPCVSTHISLLSLCSLISRGFPNTLCYFFPPSLCSPFRFECSFCDHLFPLQFI